MLLFSGPLRCTFIILNEIHQIHLCSFVHFQYIQADSSIHLHSRDKSGFLYTRQRLLNQMKKLGFQNDAKIVVHKPLPYLRVQAIAVFNLLADCGEHEIVVPCENELSLQKKLSRNNF